MLYPSGEPEIEIPAEMDIVSVYRAIEDEDDVDVVVPVNYSKPLYKYTTVDDVVNFILFIKSDEAYTPDNWSYEWYKDEDYCFHCRPDTASVQSLNLYSLNDCGCLPVRFNDNDIEEMRNIVLNVNNYCVLCQFPLYYIKILSEYDVCDVHYQ
uniref:PxGV-Corf63 protein n=1 Tax=Plutella xylostella granulovirus TaxID=98383 RepID=A0A142DW24_9BBAC|nr:PxGV-Corf63 protein [Plutella xylostella granulovirus]AMQ35792.1 PxGV-Korf63 protein [Plutella xylostella granulovirus]AMQ35909.1 PxGV-Morf63 protein [Plutella xylostella granulovirus]